MEEFTKQDLDDFNRLLGKLNQNPATPYEFEEFSDLPSSQVAEVVNDASGISITKVHSVIHFGVRWEGKVLRKAIIRGCSGDYVALSKASEQSRDIAKFTNGLGDRFTEEIELKPSDVEDYFNDWGLHDRGDNFLAVLEKSHPDHDFIFIHVRAGEEFIDRNMKVNGLTIQGQHCLVTEVTHKGLQRKSNPKWCIPAFVKIQNQDPSERV